MNVPNIAGRTAAFAIAVASIMLLNCWFKDNIHSARDLVWPFETWWLVCVVGGIVGGEWIRRTLLKRETRNAGSKR